MTGALAVLASLGGEVINPALAFDFSSPPQLVSASLNGTTQSFLSPSSSTNAAFTQAGDFTVESWFRPTNVTGTHYLFTLGTEAANRYSVYLVGTTVTSSLYGGSAVTYTSTMPINTWAHIAVVRSGSTVTLYINGTADATTDTQAGTIGNGVLRIGADSSAANRFAGQISNFRVDASAVYPGNFTTPTRPLSLTGAAFFAALGVSPFVDSSTNAITITNTGTVTLSDLSPFAATWTDSVSGIVATVAGAAQFGNNNPTYDPRYGGGLMFGESPRQTYVDVPAARGVGGGFTISIAAQIPGSPQNHYNAIICGNTVSRSGRYVMSRYWQGDGLEFGHIENWLTGGFLTMNQLAWYDYVYSANGTTVALYKNGSLVTSGTVSGTVLGWLNPLRFGGDESITGVNANTMATGVMYRMIHQKTALTAGAVATQYASIKSTYGLP
jgi:hypothetical protein